MVAPPPSAPGSFPAPSNVWSNASSRPLSGVSSGRTRLGAAAAPNIPTDESPQADQPDEAQQPPELFRARSVEMQFDVATGRHHDHEVRREPPRPGRARGLPVREVRRAHDNGHTWTRDPEANRVLGLVNTVDGHGRQPAARDTAASWGTRAATTRDPMPRVADRGSPGWTTNPRPRTPTVPTRDRDPPPAGDRSTRPGAPPAPRPPTART